MPTQRTNALGHTFSYHYDKARRLVDLINENGARYRFAYDVLDRLIAESGFDHKLIGYCYNAGNELVEQCKFGDDASLADLRYADDLTQSVKATQVQQQLDVFLTCWCIRRKTPCQTYPSSVGRHFVRCWKRIFPHSTNWRFTLMRFHVTKKH